MLHGLPVFKLSQLNKEINKLNLQSSNARLQEKLNLSKLSSRVKRLHLDYNRCVLKHYIRLG